MTGNSLREAFPVGHLFEVHTRRARRIVSTANQGREFRVVTSLKS